MSDDARVTVEWCEPNGTYLVNVRIATTGAWTHMECSPDGLVEAMLEAGEMVSGVSSRYSIKDNMTGEWIA